MRRVLVALGLLLVVLPVAASIKAMNLYEQMEITSDTLVATIVARDTIVSDHPWAGSVYTRLTLQGESLRTGEPVTTRAVFMGSHDPADEFNHSEMPELRDVRLGNEVVVFFAHDEAIAGGVNLIHNLASVYRVERGFGEPVVIGKGSGAPFAENMKLSDARALVLATHQAILADRAALEQEGK